MTKLRVVGLICFLLLVARLAGAPPNLWIASWASSPQPLSANPDEPLLKIEDQTVRERVRVSIGGRQIRIRLANGYGSAPLLVGSATVAVPVDTASVKPASIRKVTFGGRTSVTIPARGPLLSDPVEFPVTAGAEIAVSLYFPKRVVTPTGHALALKRNVVSSQGDYSRAGKIEGGAITESSILVSAILVPADPAQRLIVAFGDSITDGDGSTVDADRNWPSLLARRLAKTPEGSKIAVVNEGLAGNRLLTDGVGPSYAFGASALARFDRDVLLLPGATHIVLLEGINDIGFPGARLGGQLLADPADARTEADLIAGYLQLISRAHVHGIKVIGATITPFEGVDLPGYYSDSKEALRQSVNKWVRTSGSFDGVIDFDAVLRDPEHPARMSSRFSSPDHLHPNDLGYSAMAGAIDLALFR